jgi:hypothetical protein
MSGGRLSQLGRRRRCEECAGGIGGGVVGVRTAARSCNFGGDGGVGPEQRAEGLDPTGLGAGMGGDDSRGVTFEVQVQWRSWRDDRAAALLR